MTGVIDPPTPGITGVLLGDRYRVEALVGRGGYASVYRAVDERLDRTVALKVFAAEAASDADAARVAAETRVLASLTHPSLVTLFDAHLDDDPPYLVMEYIEGPTLSARIADGPVDPRTLATVAADLAEALRLIHARGIVHRDLKPSNVLLRPGLIDTDPPRGTLADFGIAYLMDSARVTATGTLIGTAAYLSPEQARGERPAPPADIYALGLVLLEALTGRRAYPQTTPHEALVARLVRSPSIPETIPRGWRALLSRMTAMDPAARPDAAEVQRTAMRLVADPLDQTEDLADITMPQAAADSDPAAVHDTPTAVLPPPLPPVPAESAAAVSPPAAQAARTGGRMTPRGRWLLLIGVLAAVVLAAVLTAVLLTTGAPPAAEPTLPSVPDPLGGHLRQLFEQVAP